MIDEDGSGWISNGAGLHLNESFGAGLADASAAVAMAQGATPLTGNLIFPGVPVVIPDGDSEWKLHVSDTWYVFEL